VIAKCPTSVRLPFPLDGGRRCCLQAPPTGPAQAAAYHFPAAPASSAAAALGRRRFCAATQASAPATAAAGEAVGEFWKRLLVVDVKGGKDEGAAWVGKEFAVRGWVRTCRAQRTVTFVEVRK
jgi:asparaginyl-tRNA synthetase